MKKYTLIMTVVMMAAVVTGCGSGANNNAAAVVPQEQAAQQETEQNTQPQPEQAVVPEQSADQTAVQEQAAVQKNVEVVTPQNNSGNKQQTAQTNQTQKPAQNQTTTDILTEAEAKQIALTHAQIAEAEAVFVKIKLGYDDGIQEYEIEFYVQNKEYDYEINAATGEILSFDYDIESQVPVIQNAQPQQNTQANAGAASQTGISIDEAKQIALSKVSGANDTHIRINQDMDDGRMTFEGKIVYNEMEYDFEIDAASGNILEWEAESIYD